MKKLSEMSLQEIDSLEEKYSLLLGSVKNFYSSLTETEIRKKAPDTDINYIEPSSNTLRFFDKTKFGVGFTKFEEFNYALKIQIKKFNAIFLIQHTQIGTKSNFNANSFFLRNTNLVFEKKLGKGLFNILIGKLIWKAKLLSSENDQGLFDWIITSKERAYIPFKVIDSTTKHNEISEIVKV